MSIPFIISVMSHDKVGIVADVTCAVKSLNGNLDDISQTVMKGFFTMILLADFPDGTTEQHIRKALHAAKGLSQFEIGVLPYNPDYEHDNTDNGDNSYVLTASGRDNIGLVAAITAYLRLRDINIIDLATRRDSGVYTMMFLVNLPNGTDVAKLKKSLSLAMEPYGLNVELRHQALFRKANEI